MTKSWKPDWECPIHHTWGDKGYSCAKCGYPLGEKYLEFVDNNPLVIRKIKAVINLFFFTLFVYEVFDLRKSI